MKLALLSGGVGGSRFARALGENVPPENVTVIGNVGDDLEVLGVYVSPDLDSVLYRLAGVADEERGWGRRDETWHALEANDEYTSSHARWIRDMALEVGTALGLDSAALKRLELGERIIAPIDRLEDVRPIVRSCHEHWDGSGYPDGKRGEEIPLESRIILVCDAFHAMTTDRPYRKRLSTAEALRRLRQGAGTQFDPRVVEVYLRVLDIQARSGVAAA